VDHRDQSNSIVNSNACPTKENNLGREGSLKQETEPSKINIIENEFTLDNRIRTVSGFAPLRS
jgi:hypothetical protein